MSTATAERPASVAGAVAPEYLDTSAAAALLSVSESALYQSRHGRPLCGSTGPQWVRMGRHIRYRRRDLIEWAESIAREGERATFGVPLPRAGQ